MDAQFIVVVARDATLPNIDLETISLLGSGQKCTHVDSNSEFAIYQFPVTGCGSVVMVRFFIYFLTCIFALEIVQLLVPVDSFSNSSMYLRFVGGAGCYSLRKQNVVLI